MSDTSAEEKFSVLCEIVRAQHFAWREAVRQLCPDIDPTEVVERMWRLTGHQTAKSYARRIDRTKPLAVQVASCIAWSSRSMGEDASVETSEGKDEAFVRHTSCPWLRWHQRLDLLKEDRPGCDSWFHSTVDGISAALGTDVRVETLEAMPDGDPCCLRRIWVEE